MTFDDDQTPISHESQTSTKQKKSLVSRVRARRLTLGAALFIVPILLFVAFFFPSFSPNARFSYRDVAFYYYPLFQQIQSEWESGRLPLWNPYENLGQPLAADPTSSVFYPGKLVFFLSSFHWISYAVCFKLYLWSHVALMFCTAFALARKLKISRSGSVLSGMTYAFSGQTLFQYTNVIYLVGSAWAPALFLFTIEFFRSGNFQSRVKALLKLSAVQAVTILGGEPQVVYLTFLFTLLVVVYHRIRNHRAESTKADSIDKFESVKDRKSIISWRSLLTFALLTPTFVFCLSAIQILPSSEIVSRSSRALQDKPRSLWEIPAALTNENTSKADFHRLCEKSFYDDLLCNDFSTDGRSRSIYRFSIGPWRFFEFLFPNVGGRQFPQSSRWFSALPEETSVWTPTLYFGIFPFLLALSSFRLRSRKTPRVDRNWTQIATYLVVLSALASMGGYGLVWFGKTILSIVTASAIPATFSDYDPVGGLYWLLNVLAPKFAEFRYPAKTMTLAMIGFSCLAGFGWDHRLFSSQLKKVSALVLTLSVVGFIVVQVWGDSLFSNVQTTDALYGPFQSDLAVSTVSRSFLQCAIVVVLCLLAVTFKQVQTARSANKFALRATTYIVLSIAACDVFLANSWTIVVSPASLFDRRSILSESLESELSLDGLSRRPKLASSVAPSQDERYDALPPTRIYRFPVWFPPLFQEKSSPNRNDERVLWDVETLFPQYSSHKGIATIDVRGAVVDAQYEKFINALINRNAVASDLAFLGVDYLVGPRLWVERLANASDANDLNADWRVTFQKTPKPIVCGGIFRNDRRVDSIFLNDENDIESAKDSVKILSYEPNRIAYLVTTSQKSDVVFAEQYWPDWTIKTIPIRNTQAEQLKNARFNAKEIIAFSDRFREQSQDEIKEKSADRAYGFLRKTTVPQGTYCVIAQYRPKKLAVGAVVTIASWILLICISVVLRSKNTPYRRSNKEII